MENDSIRASGTDTLVDIWINGKLRAICVTKGAIDAIVGIMRADGMSEEDRCEFVRGHLPLVVTAVKARLSESGADSDSVAIEAGQLGRVQALSGGDRRKGERRKGDRRKVDRPKEELPHGERRRGERRKGERRRPPTKSS